MLRTIVDVTILAIVAVLLVVSLFGEAWAAARRKHKRQA